MNDMLVLYEIEMSFKVPLLRIRIDLAATFDYCCIAKRLAILMTYLASDLWEISMSNLVWQCGDAPCALKAEVFLLFTHVMISVKHGWMVINGKPKVRR